MFYVLCDENCRYEAMTKEQTLAAIQQALEQGYVSDPANAVFSKIKEINANGTAQLWIGTETQFNALNPQPATSNVVIRLAADGKMYLCSDDKTLDGKANADHTHTEFATIRHTHAPSDLTAAVPIAKGGTGATTATAARYNLLGDIVTSNYAINSGTEFVICYTTPNADNGMLIKIPAWRIQNYIRVYSATEPTPTIGKIWLKPVE